MPPGGGLPTLDDVMTARTFAQFSVVTALLAAWPLAGCGEGDVAATVDEVKAAGEEAEAAGENAVESTKEALRDAQVEAKELDIPAEAKQAAENVERKAKEAGRDAAAKVSEEAGEIADELQQELDEEDAERRTRQPTLPTLPDMPDETPAADVEDSVEEPAAETAAAASSYDPKLLGTWEMEYHGDWTCTLEAGGTGKTSVVFDWVAALRYGTRIDFDLTWEIIDGKLVESLPNGTPKANYKALVADYGDTRVYEIVEVTDKQLVLRSTREKSISKWTRKSS